MSIHPMRWLSDTFPAGDVSFGDCTTIAWKDEIKTSGPKWGYRLSYPIRDLSLNKRDIEETRGVHVVLFEDVTKLFPDSPFRVIAKAYFRYSDMVAILMDNWGGELSHASLMCGLYQKNPAFNHFGNDVRTLKTIKNAMTIDDDWTVTNSTIQPNIPDSTRTKDLFHSRFHHVPLSMALKYWNKEVELSEYVPSFRAVIDGTEIEVPEGIRSWYSFITCFHLSNRDFERREIAICPFSDVKLRAADFDGNGYAERTWRNPHLFSYFLRENGVERAVLFGDRGFFPDDYAAHEMDLLMGSP